MFLWGEPSIPGERMTVDEVMHRAYAEQVCNEVEVEEIVKGKLVRKWTPKGENHWLDASYYSCVAANMRGAHLPMTQTAKTTVNIPAVRTGLPAPTGGGGWFSQAAKR